MTVQRSSPTQLAAAQSEISDLSDVDDHKNSQDVKTPVPILTRISLKNYRSIAGCVVDLQPMTLLVGPNGAGKSNFIDGIKFTSDALRATLEHALRERGGIGEVRRRSRGHPTHFGVRLELHLPGDLTAVYAYQVAAKKGSGFEVSREDCRVGVRGRPIGYFSIEKGRLRSTSDKSLPSRIAPDRLLLQLASARSPFNEVYSALVSLGFYNLNLRAIRELQDPDVGDLLLSEGANLAAVIERIDQNMPHIAERLEQYLSAVVPGVRGVSHKSLGPKETIEIRQEVAGDPNPWRYLAANVSDGTLRALGVLVAVLQGGRDGNGIPLVAIEEPEIAIHPGAAVRLMDALLEAANSRQLIITTHSPDLLDHPSVDVNSILAVESHQGNSIIAPVDDQTREALKESLYTVGELLRLEQVKPDIMRAEQRADQLKLF